MNREILFRGKLSHSGLWIEGNLIIANTGEPYIIPPNCIEPDGHHLSIDDAPFWVIPESVGQFTGLTDVNGVKVFEGDLINCVATQRETNTVIEEDDCPIEVKFSKGYFYPFGYNCGWRSSVSDVEVIGNITDNSELLEGE